MVGRGSWTIGVAAIIELTCAGRRSGRGPGGVRFRSLTRSAIASMWVGRGAAAAADDRDAVALDELAEGVGQRPGLLGEDRLAVGALQREAGVGDAVHRHRAELAEEADRVAHVLGAGGAVEADDVDLERLQRGQHRADVGAQEHLAALGQQGDAALDRDRAAGQSLAASRTPNTAALSSRMSWVVSMMMRSTPPSISPVACSANTVRSSGKVIWPSVGSSEAGRKPVGPIAPATNRCSPAALRAICAALRLISCVWSSRPHSPSFSRLAWNVSVSSTSAPASSIEACTPSITSGRLSTSASWQRPGSR